MHQKLHVDSAFPQDSAFQQWLQGEAAPGWIAVYLAAVFVGSFAAAVKQPAVVEALWASMRFGTGTGWPARRSTVFPQICLPSSPRVQNVGLGVGPEDVCRQHGDRHCFVWGAAGFGETPEVLGLALLGSHHGAVGAHARPAAAAGEGGGATRLSRAGLFAGVGLLGLLNGGMLS